MYGFFIHGFEKFIIAKYGKERWEVIRVNAGVFSDSFEDKMVYDDNMIIEVMDAACELLDVEVFDLQREFGEMYFDTCLNSRHGGLLQKLGGNLYDFLANIDSLHDYLGVSYPGVKLPSFRVKQHIGNCISVNCYSDHEELEYMIPSVIERAAKVLFDLDVQAAIPISNIKTIIVTTTNPDDSDRMFPKRIESSRDLIPGANDLKVSPLEFATVFPFHMIFDENMILRQIGVALRRILPELSTTSNAKVTTFFTLSRPLIEFTFESIYSRLNNIFVLSVKSSGGGHVSYLNGDGAANNHQVLMRKNSDRTRQAILRLKGEMVYIEEKQVLLFLSSPVVTNIQDMRNKGLYLDDIPVHDATRDLVLICDNVHKELELAQQLNIVSDHLQKIYGEMEENLELYNRLLYAVLPTSIAQRLGSGKSVPTERFQSVTLMFSGIVDFAAICSKNIDPKSIVDMLNRLYTKFDGIVTYAQNYAYKVETVGDKYMTASGVPEKVSNHPVIVCRLALDMYNVARDVRLNGKPISLTFGIHSGVIVAGVIGHKMPRYCLFGNTVNLTSRTETTGVPGCINLTEDTYKLLKLNEGPSPEFYFEERGLVKMKGKSEPMKTYILNREKSRSVKRAIPCHSLIQRSNQPDSEVKSSGTNDYISLYRNLRQCPSYSGKKSRSLSRFTTPGSSRASSIMQTPGLRSRCSSGVSFGGAMTTKSSLYDSNNNIFEDVELSTTPMSIHSMSRLTKDDVSDFNARFMDGQSYADSIAAPSVMSEYTVENVTRMLDDVNKSLNKEKKGR